MQQVRFTHDWKYAHRCIDVREYRKDSIEELDDVAAQAALVEGVAVLARAAENKAVPEGSEPASHEEEEAATEAAPATETQEEADKAIASTESVTAGATEKKTDTPEAGPAHPPEAARSGSPAPSGKAAPSSSSQRGQASRGKQTRSKSSRAASAS